MGYSNSKETEETEEKEENEEKEEKEENEKKNDRVNFSIELKYVPSNNLNCDSNYIPITDIVKQLIDGIIDCGATIDHMELTIPADK